MVVKGSTKKKIITQSRILDPCFLGCLCNLRSAISAKNQASVNVFSHERLQLASYFTGQLPQTPTYILMETSLSSILPRMADRRFDLPEPTVPTIATHSFYFIFKFILLRKGYWNCRHNLLFGNRWCRRPRKIIIIQNHAIFFVFMASYVI